MLIEPVSDLTSEDVIERMNKGAELWFAGSSGDRVTLVDRDSTTVIAHEVLTGMIERGEVRPELEIGSLVQYQLLK